MFFSCSCWMRSALALLSFSKQRLLCTYWLFKNFKSDDSWSSFLMWFLSSETRLCKALESFFAVHDGEQNGKRVRIVLRMKEQHHCLPLVTPSFSSFSLRSSWWSSLFSLTIRAFSALYGSRKASMFRLSLSVLPADSLALRRLSVVWTRSLEEKWRRLSYTSSGVTDKTAGAEGIKASPEQLVHQRQWLYSQRLPIAQLIQPLPQIDEFPFCAVHGCDVAPTSLRHNTWTQWRAVNSLFRLVIDLKNSLQQPTLAVELC